MYGLVFLFVLFCYVLLFLLAGWLVKKLLVLFSKQHWQRYVKYAVWAVALFPLYMDAPERIIYEVICRVSYDYEIVVPPEEWARGREKDIIYRVTDSNRDELSSNFSFYFDLQVRNKGGWLRFDNWEVEVRDKDSGELLYLVNDYSFSSTKFISEVPWLSSGGCSGWGVKDSYKISVDYIEKVVRGE